MNTTTENPSIQPPLIIELVRGAFNLLEEIGQVTSTTAKQKILAQGENNFVLKSILVLAYNPFLQYNIKKIPCTDYNCQSRNIHAQTYVEFLKLLSRLEQRIITGNTAMEYYEAFLASCCKDEYKWYTRVVNKDLRIGLADKSINKVFKNLIPTYEVLLAEKIPADCLSLDTPKALKMLPRHIVTQYKIDGYRLNIHVDTAGGVQVTTRNGKVVSGYNDLEKEAHDKLPWGFVYDGEVVAPELFAWIESNIQNGGVSAANRDLFSEAVSHAFSKETNKQGVFNLFDMIPIKEWVEQKPTEPLSVRTHRILRDVKPLDLNNIRVVPTSRVYDRDNPADMKEVVDTFHYYLSIGWEGLMIKNWDALYEFKRSKNLLKMKLMDSLDLPVVDIFEGTGKYTGMMGGVYVDYKGYKVGVGSGWSDDQRLRFWKYPNEILGKTLEIAYQAETKNKDGGLSLSFPVVKQIRFDK